MMATDLGPLPADHPRRAECEKAQQCLTADFEDVCKRFKLTSAEAGRALSKLLYEFTARLIAIERRQQPTQENAK